MEDISIRQALVDRRGALRSALVGSLRSVGEHDPGGRDPLDLALDTSGETSAALANMEAREIVSIDQALERLAAGQYGACESCGEQIPPERLEALPDARHCVRCQSQTERSAERRDHVARDDWFSDSSEDLEAA
jgi:DnaK suppressor protein